MTTNKRGPFECVACAHAENADINAGQNILAAGLAVLACGEMVHAEAGAHRSEPTEVTRQLIV